MEEVFFIFYEILNRVIGNGEIFYKNNNKIFFRKYFNLIKQSIY